MLASHRAETCKKLLVFQAPLFLSAPPFVFLQARGMKKDAAVGKRLAAKPATIAKLSSAGQLWRFPISPLRYGFHFGAH
ncbi:MAG: hypothetical protein L0387_11680 [Acidobacteria bacterium]|nr:hypothetical protein [Acidobacteriota bacterium]MCI0723068.1 hypothetical protein [Acidobacteriota bacterium]